MAERPILGLRKNERISAVHQTIRIRELVSQEPRRKAVTIDGISVDIAAATGVEIPADFLIESGFIDLRWTMIFHPNALSAIYLGFGDNQPTTEDFDDAKAVVALHSRNDVVAEPLLEHGFAIRPKRIEVTAVLPDSAGKQRIVGGSFSPTNGERMTRFISFEYDEAYTQPQWHHFIQEDLTPHQIPVNRMLDQRDSVYGEVYPLISAEMVRTAGHRIITDANSRQSHLRSIYAEQTGHEFVTKFKNTGRTAAWDINYPRELIKL